MVLVFALILTLYFELYYLYAERYSSTSFIYTTPSLIISISLISLGCQHIHSHPLTPILYWLTTFYHGNHRCWLYYLYPGIYTRPLAELLNLNPRIHI